MKRLLSRRARPGSAWLLAGISPTKNSTSSAPKTRSLVTLYHTVTDLTSPENWLADSRYLLNKEEFVVSRHRWLKSIPNGRHSNLLDKQESSVQKSCSETRCHEYVSSWIILDLKMLLFYDWQLQLRPRCLRLTVSSDEGRMLPSVHAKLAPENGLHSSAAPTYILSSILLFTVWASYAGVPAEYTSCCFIIIDTAPSTWDTRASIWLGAFTSSIMTSDTRDRKSFFTEEKQWTAKMWNLSF